MTIKFSEIVIKFEGEPASGKSQMMEIIRNQLNKLGIVVAIDYAGHGLKIPTQVVEVDP